MNTELRQLSTGDDPAHRILMNHAFHQGQVVNTENPEAPDLQNTWGIFEGAELAADLTIVPFEVHWGETAVLKMGGLAGVATFAHQRGRGYVDTLLRHALVVMRERGEVISALYPFAWSFYRRYGWEWVGEKRDTILPLRELRSQAAGKEIVAITGDDVRAALTPAYTRFAKQYRGVFTEASHRWERILAHNDSRTTHFYAHRPGGESNTPTDGYLLWRYGTNDGDARIREFVANTPTAYSGLFSLLHYFATQVDKARVILPADSALWWHIMHWDLETKTRPVFMGRVVDVERAFALLPVSLALPNGKVIVQIHDEQAPWNHGLWQIEAEAGNVRCLPVVGGGEPGVVLDIQAMSQAFWGTPSLIALRHAGRVEVRSESGYDLFCQILPPHPVFTLDDF